MRVAPVSLSAITRARSSFSDRSILKAIPATCISCIRLAELSVAMSCALTSGRSGSARAHHHARGHQVLPLRWSCVVADAGATCCGRHVRVAASGEHLLSRRRFANRDARARDSDSRFIGWEINCLGLPARGEPFDTGTLRLDLELWRSGRAVEPAPIKPDPFCLEKGVPPFSSTGCGSRVSRMPAAHAGAWRVRRRSGPC